MPRYFPPGHRWNRVQDGVLIGRSEASIGLLESTLLVAAAAVVDLTFSDDVRQRLDQAQRGVAIADIARLAQEVDSYIIENGKLPASLKNVTEGGEAPVDPWGKPYAHRVKGSFEYVIWSFGPNGTNQKGKGDDVTRPN